MLLCQPYANTIVKHAKLTPTAHFQCRVPCCLHQRKLTAHVGEGGGANGRGGRGRAAETKVHHMIQCPICGQQVKHELMMEHVERYHSDDHAPVVGSGH